VPVNPKPEILDITPIRSAIVRPSRGYASARRIQGETRIVTAKPRHERLDVSGEAPPSWWEPQADPAWRSSIWVRFPADYRNQLLAQRAGAVFSIRPPDSTDRVILWSQYHALKALATRLDAGIGTERERVAFEAGLREYNANYDRIRAQRKALLGGRT